MRRKKNQTMSKLRVDHVGGDASPRDLRELFEKVGSVEEVSVHAGGYLAYAVITMPDEDAEKAMIEMNDRGWRGSRLEVRWANRVPDRWLSPQWRPPAAPCNRYPCPRSRVSDIGEPSGDGEES